MLIFLFIKTMTFLQYRFSTYKNIYYKPLVFSFCKNTRNFKNNIGLSTDSYRDEEPKLFGTGVAKQKMRNDKQIGGDQIIMSCLLGEDLEFQSVNVMLGSAPLASFSYQFTFWCVCIFK